MKKALLSTTALVAASFLTAGIASAEVSISAAQNYMVTYKTGSKDGAKIGTEAHADTDDFKIGQSIGLEQIGWNSEINVAGSGTTDSGLNYGIDIQLQPKTSGVGTDEATVFIGGDSWGKISLGEDDDALDVLKVGANSILVGLGAEYNATVHSPSGNGDYARIMYSTPSFNGFKAAVSFTPQAEGNDTTLDSENLIAAGVNFKQDFGNMSVKVGGGLRMQSLTNRTTNAEGSAEAGKGSGGVTGFQVGVVGTFDAFSAAIGFGSDTRKDKTLDASSEKETSDTYLNGGVAYNFGQGGVSVGYYSLSRENKNVDAIKQSSSSIIIDADYKLAEGLTALLEVVLNSGDADTDNDTASGEVEGSSTVAAIGLRAAF